MHSSEHPLRVLFRAISIFHSSLLHISFWIPYFVLVNIVSASGFSSLLPCSALCSGFYSLADTQMDAVLLSPHLTSKLNFFAVNEVLMLS